MSTPETIITDAIIVKAASLASLGTNILQLSKELNISRFLVRKVMNSELFKVTLKDIGDSAISEAKHVIRSSVRDMAPEINRVLKEQLSENNLEAVKIYLRIVGFDQQEQSTGDTNINVVLPGNEKPTITVSADDPAKGDPNGF